MIPNLIISVSALPKVGKNHFAYTCPDPIKVYCFNGGASFVATKFPKKAIDINNYVLPIVDSTEQRWALPVWEKFYSEYREDVTSVVSLPKKPTRPRYSTVVLDTATEIENVCQQTVLEEQQNVKAEQGKEKAKLATTEYLGRNLRMKALFDTAKNNGVNLISLQYLKEEWIRHKGAERAESTGALILDGWKRTETQADINLRIVSIQRAVLSKGKPQQKTVSVATMESNRFDRDLNGHAFEDATFDDLVALLFPEE